MRLVIGDREYRDGDVSVAEVMDRVDEGVSTSAPTPGDFAAAIDALPADADVVILTVAETMSATRAAAALAARQAGPRVRVVDTGTASGAEGLVVLAAAELARRGADVDAVERAATDAARAVHLVATIGSLERLAKSGRVPGVAAMAARWLDLNPVFEFKSGKARPQRPARGRAAALERIVTGWRRSKPKVEARLHVAGLHAVEAAPAEQLVDAVRAEVTPATAFVAPFSAVMVSHTGPDVTGLAWWWEPVS
jgi:DegV family protein with EDD domain